MWNAEIYKLLALPHIFLAVWFYISINCQTPNAFHLQFCIGSSFCNQANVLQYSTTEYVNGKMVSPPMGAHWSTTSNTGEKNAVISEIGFIVSEMVFLCPQIQHHGDRDIACIKVACWLQAQVTNGRLISCCWWHYAFMWRIRRSTLSQKCFPHGGSSLYFILRSISCT